MNTNSKEGIKRMIDAKFKEAYEEKSKKEK